MPADDSAPLPRRNARLDGPQQMILRLCHPEDRHIARSFVVAVLSELADLISPRPWRDDRRVTDHDLIAAIRTVCDRMRAELPVPTTCLPKGGPTYVAYDRAEAA